MTTKRIEGRGRRHLRVRKQAAGTVERPRLAVFRSLKQIYAQVVDDRQGRTLVAASSLDPVLRGQASDGKITQARQVGLLLAERAKAAGVGPVVFDRAGYKYHGRVAALAEGARQGGLEF